MTLLDYIKNGNYSEVLPYLQNCRRSKRIIKSLRELTDLVLASEQKNNALESFMKGMDGEFEHDFDWSVPGSQRFNGSPRSEEGKKWVKALTERYHGIIDSRSIGMLQSAINVDWDSKVLEYNPKTYLRNYNRYITYEITSGISAYDSTDYVIFITTSSEYALDENDIKQIKNYFAQVEQINQVAIHLCINDELEDEMWLEWCECGGGSSYMTTYHNFEIERGIEEFFSKMPIPTLLSRRDFDRIQEQYDMLCMVEAVTQNGVENLEEKLKKFLYHSIPKNSPMIIICLDFPMEADASYNNVMKIINMMNVLYTDADILWGTRIDESLPANGCSVLLLAAIPDDFFNPHMGYDEV